MKRTNFSTTSPWEPLRGYSRAVCVDNRLLISGTTAMKSDGTVVGVGDAYIQTNFVLSQIKQVVQQAKFELSDVIRTRLFVTHIGEWEKYARAHHEFFGEIRPVSSIVQVHKLVDPRLMIELEVEALRGATSVENVQIKYTNE